MDIKDIITLSDNNKYVIVSKANYENKTYYYLAMIDEETNKVKDLNIYYEDDGDFVEEDNGKIIENLLPLFYEYAENNLPKEFFDLLKGIK